MIDKNNLIAVYIKEVHETFSENYFSVMNGEEYGILCLIFVVVVILPIITIVALVDGYHQVEEGHQGVYFKYGALLDEVAGPGLHFKQAFVTKARSVVIRPEEVTMSDVQAITRDGIEINFDHISVLSRTNASHVLKLIKTFGIEFKQVLIYDRIKEDLQIFCANKTVDEIYNEKFLEIVEAITEDVKAQIKDFGEEGVEILNLVVSKPSIPADIAQNYKQVKVQWTKQLVAKQEKVTEEIKKETELLKAVADANREKEVLAIKIEEQILETKGKQNVSEINNKIEQDKENNLADIAEYAKQAEARGNKELFSPDYVKLEVAKSLANNTKIFFSGENTALGGLLSKILT